MTRDERIRAALGRSSLPVIESTASTKRQAPKVQTPCRFRGPPDGGVVDCPSCQGTVRLKTFSCAKYGRCTVTKHVDGLATCVGCPAFRPGHRPRPPWDGAAPLKLDSADLYPELPGHRFNPALAAWGDGYVFVWRDGWAGSDLWACRLDAGFLPVGEPQLLDLAHWAAGYGREDPQLFVYGGALHVTFVGVQGAGGRVLRTNVLFARLDADLRAGPVYAPRAPDVSPSRWQKNWGFFEHDGGLYAVYSIDPHRVLRIRGNSAEWLSDELPNPLPWTGGERRGGAPPQLVGDELWTFFHDRVDRAGSRPLYRLGLITNDARPPFAPRRHVPVPLAVADPATNPGNYCDCLFPRGAIQVGPNWVLSLGVHDRWSELRAFDHADLERRLVGL